MQAGEGGGGVIGMEATVLRRFMETEGDDDDDDMFLGMDAMEPAGGFVTTSAGDFCFPFDFCLFVCLLVFFVLVSWCFVVFWFRFLHCFYVFFVFLCLSECFSFVSFFCCVFFSSFFRVLFLFLVVVTLLLLFAFVHLFISFRCCSYFSPCVWCTELVK